MKRGIHSACDDFHQTSEARRKMFLDAPVTRRHLIGYGLGASLSIYAAKAMPFNRILEAAQAEAAAAPNAPVLVSVFLPGGLDLMDTLVPVAQYGTYADLHPGLKVAAPESLGSTGFGLHPALSKGLNGGIKGLYDQGKIGFIPGIDYANPDLSHFHSRHFWDTGTLSTETPTGWLGRWLDRNGSRDNPVQAISCSYNLSLAVRAAKAPVAVVSSIDSTQFDFPSTYGTPKDKGLAAWAKLAARPSKPGPAAAHSAVRSASQAAKLLAPYSNDSYLSQLPYPQNKNFAERLQTIAALLAQPLGIRVATVEADGDFDTHDNQAKELPVILEDVSTALSVFQADLEQRGIADRVLTLVWSEFGRRPRENRSGTDHGAAGLAWVMGTRVKSGILTEYPSLTQFDKDDNLLVTTDFRKVYGSILEQWFGTGADAIIPGVGSLGRVGLVA